MSDWGHGYQKEIPYTRGFYPELAPNHLETALLFSGFRTNPVKAGARYCELGCGFGLTTLILAASNPHISFVGIDFNPTHIASANSLAEAANLSNVRFIEASFEELLTPTFADLGKFDIIALHGTYSWVTPAVRQAIVEFAGAALQTGGALYLSYNAAPGRVPQSPLQRLLFEFARRSSEEPASAMAAAFRFAKSMKDAGAVFFRSNPQVGAFLDSMERHNLTYLIHEHINEGWSTLYHADVVADFSSTRLSYACAANLADDIDEVSIPKEARPLLAGISDRVWRETVKDFLVGRSFRRDIFVRGPVKLTATEQMNELNRTFVLTVPRSAATSKITTPIGKVEGSPRLYSRIFDLLARGPTRLSQFLHDATDATRSAAALIQALALLIHSDQVKMVRPEAEIDIGPSQRLNLVLMHEIEAGRPIHFLAAPAIGNGVRAELSSFGLLQAIQRGLKLESGTIAQATWELIENTPIRPKKDGIILQSKSDALPYLTQAAEELLTDRLHTLKMLGIFSDAKKQQRVIADSPSLASLSIS